MDRARSTERLAADNAGRVFSSAGVKVSAYRLSITLATMSCALMVVACGSSSKHNGSASNTHVQGVRYADCMRSQGVSKFPDPAPGGGFDLRALGVEAESPAFLAAQTACAKLQPGGSQRPRPFTRKQEQQMVARARCIRTHGVRNFPDPMTVGPGMFGEPYLPPGWNPDAPSVVKALNACAHVGTTIPSPDGGL
jgi:hypothetical protein